MTKKFMDVDIKFENTNDKSDGFQGAVVTLSNAVSDLQVDMN